MGVFCEDNELFLTFYVFARKTTSDGGWYRDAVATSHVVPFYCGPDTWQEVVDTLNIALMWDNRSIR